jgi:hypothetical protein
LAEIGGLDRQLMQGMAGALEGGVHGRGLTSRSCQCARRTWVRRRLLTIEGEKVVLEGMNAWGR